LIEVERKPDFNSSVSQVKQDYISHPVKVDVASKKLNIYLYIL